MHQLILFASGTGSNVAAIHEYFAATGTARIALVVCNNPTAGVINYAGAQDIPCLLTDRQRINEPVFAGQLKAYNPSLIVLAGFLWKVPDAVIHTFPGQIINIHPALLPKYGGKGMYGRHVHQAVLAAGDAQSGITIHEVNEVYDEGKTLLQAHCSALPADTAEALAARVQQLEHFYFPRTIEFLLAQL